MVEFFLAGRFRVASLVSFFPLGLGLFDCCGVGGAGALVCCGDGGCVRPLPLPLLLPLLFAVALPLALLPAGGACGGGIWLRCC